MLILYTKDNCVYCDRVKSAFAERKVVYEERNVKNPDFLEEAKGLGIRAVPYLVDTTANAKIEGSDDIIDYASEYNF